ncbi:hypothetical protein BGZ73_008609 [Actinomortierella ambigua]|nr:hypothetical protein BGZ73_008609 [Actinomortierella ambigua]
MYHVLHHQNQQAKPPLSMSTSSPATWRPVHSCCNILKTVIDQNDLIPSDITDATVENLESEASSYRTAYMEPSFVMVTQIPGHHDR